jgi:amino acid transporter/nucleotide-binding universal stress UspA family protein
MVGSGIFVLPGLATKIGGPSVVLAYLLAGLVVLPAALSKAEMATAMPEAGGTYLYVDRALGPFMGTIAGLGVWFSLTFKSAFALVGLGAYLMLFTDLPTRPVSIGLALLLVGVNILGVKQTGRLQSLIVTLVMGVLIVFVVLGTPEIDRAAFDPLFPEGAVGLLAATGFVFVSYAGVTKIASVAEEVRNPGRNIPAGILLSVLVMMVVYTLIVGVLIGIAPASELQTSLTPMALAAQNFLGSTGGVLISITAVLALTSMANAGILATSRFPFAMSRNRLAPSVLQRVHPRFRTPIASILVTGALLVALVAFVPVVELAKLASAFKILIFCLVNISLITFREAQLDWYRPDFRSPWYPWVQLFGIVAGLVLLTQMGTVPMLGAVAIVVAGIVWYQLYGRPRTDREGVALEALRHRHDQQALGLTREALRPVDTFVVLVPSWAPRDEERQRSLLSIASALIGSGEGSVRAIRFDEVPEQIELHTAADITTSDDTAFETSTGRIGAELGIQVEVGEVVSHDWKRALLHYIDDHGVDLVLTDELKSPNLLRPLSRDVAWLSDHADVDAVVLGAQPIAALHEIVVMGGGGPFDVLKVSIADRLALREGARIRFVQVAGPKATPARLAAIEAYHQQLAELCNAPTVSVIERADDRVAALIELARDADLVVLGASIHRAFHNPFGKDFAHRLSDEIEVPVLLVHAHRTQRGTFMGALIDRLAYR